MEKEIEKKLNIIIDSVNNIKTDVGSLKTDVGSLKTDVGSLKTDVGSLKTDMEQVKTGVAVNKANIVYGFAEAKTERAEIKKRINQVYDSVDGFSKTVNDLQIEFETNKEDSKRIKGVINEKLGVDLT